MKHTKVVLLVAAAVLLLAVGCAKNYKITQALQETYNTVGACEIGAVRDALPPDFDPDDKPTQEHMDKFQTYLINELNERRLFGEVSFKSERPTYRIDAALLDFAEGSGFLRFLFGAWAGSAKMTVHLELVDIENDEVIFAGNFSQTVTHYSESGDKIFERVAEDFAKELDEQLYSF